MQRGKDCQKHFLGFIVIDFPDLATIHLILSFLSILLIHSSQFVQTDMLSLCRHGRLSGHLSLPFCSHSPYSLIFLFGVSIPRFVDENAGQLSFIWSRQHWSLLHFRVNSGIGVSSNVFSAIYLMNIINTHFLYICKQEMKFNPCVHQTNEQQSG